MIDKILAAGRVSDDVAALLAMVKETHRGIVFVSQHSGNWELAITAGMKTGIKAAGVAAPKTWAQLATVAITVNG